MNAPAFKRMTVPEFLAWAESQNERRYELLRGEIIANAAERTAHVRAKLRAANALQAAITRAGIACEAFVDGLTVVVDEETCYEPDALVNCGDRIADDTMIAPNPVVVVEVLSLTTGTLDKTIKLADYFRVQSLAHYLIVDPGRQLVVHYRRQSGGAILPAILEDGEISLEPPGITVAVADLVGEAV